MGGPVTFTPGRPQEHDAGLDTEPGTVRVMLLHNPHVSKPWRVETVEYHPQRQVSGTSSFRPSVRPAGWYSRDGDFLAGIGQVTDKSFRTLGRAVRHRHAILAALEVHDIEGIVDGDASAIRWERVR
jgi:hypothetical protein